VRERFIEPLQKELSDKKNADRKNAKGGTGGDGKEGGGGGGGRKPGSRSRTRG
jgi:hypothetical protein